MSRRDRQSAQQALIKDESAHAVADVLPLPVLGITCLTCHFMRATTASDGSGYCMRFPPSSTSGFACVRPIDWCGEHKGKAAA